MVMTAWLLGGSAFPLPSQPAGTEVFAGYSTVGGTYLGVSRSYDLQVLGAPIRTTLRMVTTDRLGSVAQVSLQGTWRLGAFGVLTLQASQAFPLDNRTTPFRPRPR